VSGTAYSYSNIVLNCAGQNFTAFRSIDYDYKVARTMIRGNSPYPLSKTVGEYTFTCSAEIEFSEFSMFLQQVASGAATSASPTPGPASTAGFGQQFFQITVMYENQTQNPNGVITDTIYGATIDEISASMKVGSEGIWRKIEFNPLSINFNGNMVGPVPVAFQQTSLLSLNSVGTGSGALQT
jgi:hypothetical protein